jgi:hypothetical protein
MNSKNKINNIIEYNNNNERNKNNINENSNSIITKNGYKCIAPCIDKNTLYYHPITFQAIQKSYPSCPIYDMHAHKDQVLYYDKCNIKDNNNIKNKKYNIFDNDNDIEFAITPNNFLIEVYDIKNIIDVINFLNNNIHDLPIYTQKRLLNYIYDIYNTYDDFPFDLFIQITIDIFDKIYKIKLNIIKINKKIKTIKNKNNIFEYLLNKYSK